MGSIAGRGAGAGLPATGTENTNITSPCLRTNCRALPVGGLTMDMSVCCADSVLILQPNLLSISVGEPMCTCACWLCRREALTRHDYG